MSGFETLALIAGGIGTAVQTFGTIQAGREANARAQYEAKVQEQQADEAYAASQRDAAEKYRQGRLMLSQQRAAIAGSGGDLTDPSVLDIMGDTAAEIDLAARTDIYKGDQQARGYNDAAKNSRISGKNALNASYISAAGSLFSGVSNMYSRFGQQARSTKPASGSTRPLYG
ncbi:hypothetical protein CYG48_05055 [Neorhizobium sp. SOG26]|uniref:hypothetical protein n=1 Tax=Neorhizobium sp. SOG26 TaxID=2060726 RepID=UPI000E567BE0|nr:hypothetical protein [Neorhizobium sp. SOG26]AXV15122.1 hypothetical protein CYG48_05055 [Neorhizobium sp. SOG26]